ncbi:MAG: starch-binding protein [Ruminococcus sp.]|nr:starch-binding protein [Ruminococcus sp.]
MKKQLIKLCSVFISLLLVLSAVITSDATVFVSESVSSQGDLPDIVDNSQSKYFPPIDTQGDQGSCVCWAQGYYQFTYMMNRELDIATTSENAFSARWLYNLANGGRSAGTWENDVYNMMKEIGCLRQSDAEFSNEDDQNWYPTEEMWKTAMQYRISDYTIFKNIGEEDSQITSPDDPDLTNIKTLLAQGEVLAGTTYISSWKVGRLKQNSSAPENDKYLNEYVVMYEDGTSVRHRLAIVGYNDNIWTDINSNDKVDAGEMGALKIANSWGTDRHNQGFMWIAYDALNRVSCVSNAPVPDYRPAAFHDYTQIEILPYDFDTELYFRYTLNTSDRGQCRMYATATKGDTTYTFELGPKRQHGMYANTFSYDGTTKSNDGTMVYALSNLVPDITSETLHEYQWSIKFEDEEADGIVFTVKNMEIVDDTTGRVVRPDNVYPLKLDGTSKEVTFPQFEYAEPTAPSTSSQPAETEATTGTELITTEPLTTATTTVTTSTEATVTDPVEYVYGLSGDSNQSGDISISDATLIQKYISNLVDEGDISLLLSDCDADTKVTIKDATCIQKYLAELKDSGITGTQVLIDTIIPTQPSKPADPTESTEASTPFVTTAPTEATDPTEPSTIVTEPVTTEPAVQNTVYFTNAHQWSGTVSCYYWSDSDTNMTSWPGVPMTISSVNDYGQSVYVLQIPQDAEYIIFTNGSVQTADIPYSGGEKRYYADAPSSDGKYTVKEW